MGLTKSQKIAIASIIVAVILAAIPIGFGALSWWGNFREDIGYTKGDKDSKKVGNSKPNSEVLDDNYDYFNGNDWEINGWWQKDKKTLICEPNSITERDGGPKMTNTNHFASNNFRMKVEFIPKSNSDEINFVICVGDSYEIVLGNGNRKFVYFKQGCYFTETNKNLIDSFELENEIRFDKPIEIEINQNILSNSSVMNIDFGIRYFVEENYNSEPTKDYRHFQINNDSFCNNKKKITIGLLCIFLFKKLLAKNKLNNPT